MPRRSKRFALRADQVKSASESRFAEHTVKANEAIRYRYRLRDVSEGGPVESLNAVVIADPGHLLLSVYFDELTDEPTGRQSVEDVTARPRP